MRAVVGVDTAAGKFHLYCNSGYWAGLTLPERPKLDPHERRFLLHRFARDAFQRLPRGTLVVIEEPLALRNGKTSRLLGMACGAIEAASYGLPLLVAYVDVSAWKREVIGRGDADKQQIETWVREHMGLKFEEQDLYDAAALCRWGELRLAAQADHH